MINDGRTKVEIRKGPPWKKKKQGTNGNIQLKLKVKVDVQTCIDSPAHGFCQVPAVLNHERLDQKEDHLVSGSGFRLVL